MNAKFFPFALSVVASLLGLGQAASAQSGDVASGERLYRQCAVCHDVTDPSGNHLAGRGTNAGPNLYGLFGQPPASRPGYRYSQGLVLAGQSGVVWDRDILLDYLLDPQAVTQRLSGDPNARTKMSYRMTSRQAAADVVAYLEALTN